MRKDPLHFQLVVLCAVLSVILTFLLTVTLFFFPPVTQAGSAGSARSGLSGSLLCLQVSAAQPETASVSDSSQQSSPDGWIGGENSALTNILIIGKDQWEEDSPGRSDCLILCTFNHTTRKITMTSILRDLYVTIPGHSSNRINAAYALGGSSLLKDTLRDNFGLWIDGCVEVDFSQFSRIVDLLGGVTISLRQDEAEQINDTVPGDLTEGTHLLSGNQALAYTRIRKLDPDGDFSRTNRQRKVIHSLMENYRETPPLKVISIAAQILPMLSTDMDYTQVISTVLEILPLLSGNTIHSQHIPQEGMYRYETIRGMSVLTADPREIRDCLRETLANPV